MRKSLKITMIIIIIAIVICVISVILNGLIIGGLFQPPIEKDEMKRLFYEDYEDLADVANFLATIEYKNIYISNTTESEMISASGENIVIKDEQIMHSINTLISRGYDVITKDNNTVSFQRWSNLDAGRGIAFSIDGTQPNFQFLTKLEKIRESNWYYYEEDFNEWKLKNE